MAEPLERSANSSNPFPQYPKPVVSQPSGKHRQTFIILHGRGSYAEEFGPLLLLREIPQYKNLRQTFPNAKFVFPTASQTPPVTFGRKLGKQWFENGTLKFPIKNEERQIPGLNETTGYIHHLLRQEIGIIGAKNTVLWGLSQGCAASLVASLLWNGEPFAAVVGMCGWLPFRTHLENIALGAFEVQAGEEDPFRRADEQATTSSESKIISQNVEHSRPLQAMNWLRAQLDLEPHMNSTMPVKQIPFFLGHGALDPKVYVHLGREAAICLKELQIQVNYRQYQQLGHWYSGEMLHDIVCFLREKNSWQESEYYHEESKHA